MGVSEKTFFKAFHPDAEELFNITTDLRKVATELADPRKRLPHATGAQLFRVFRPMLASRAPLEDIVAAMHHEPFVIETKYDGERVQVHKRGDDVRLFSRKSKEVTATYQSLVPLLRRNILAREAIVDGELMVWSQLTESFQP
eukprot:CAMPEP_0198329464 /NCGR_PEP_ID=MMETSP1450-20131203/16207_1 /TAXON_ID=753684 ORGANISM="Madagascaria erythrocladiodes, Strain CCMP3234" /NCGR_SAMPLE_ID=MMETSP1450 /ASSEMBLY_ACC=CAM_ASM_001115 /LENGTH=142 /DNA_ID=CAMNT_0044033685 /DNA_START=12 /DNA_END=436 /DNA_ORIENTATION=+